MSDENLWGALAISQGQFPKILKDKTVKVATRGGGGYSYSYADLASILAAVTPVLSKNGIAIVQRLLDSGVETMLLHRDGGVLSTMTPIPASSTNHDLAGAYTFFRRHALTALLGIAADDDANNASTMTHKGQPVEDVEVSATADPLDFLADTKAPATLEDCKSMDDLTRHLSVHNPSDKSAIDATKKRLTRRKN